MFKSLLKDIGLWFYRPLKVNYHSLVASKIEDVIRKQYNIGLCYTHVLVAVYKGQYLHDVAEYSIANKTLTSFKVSLRKVLVSYIPNRIMSRLELTPYRTVTLHVIGVFADNHARCVGYFKSGNKSTFSIDQTPFLEYTEVDNPLYFDILEYNKAVDNKPRK